MIKMDNQQLKQISHYIDKARHELLSNNSNNDGALLFMGEMQDPIPRTLILDPTLNAIDVRIWMLLRISIGHPTLPGKLPNQQELSHMINSTKMTIWSSMQVLRLNRWITLCDKVRDNRGKNKGNIYAIHTEPLAIADTLKLDKGYVDFIEQTLNSKVSRVRNNAMAAHIAFYKQINNHESTFTRTQIQQHDARLSAFEQHDLPTDKYTPPILSQDEQTYYAHNLAQSEIIPDFGEIEPQGINLSLVKSTQNTDEFTGYKNYTLSETAQQSHSLQGIKIDTGDRSGSSSIKRLSNTTTTTKDQAFKLKSFDRFKTFLRPSEIPIIQRIIYSLPEEAQQDVLDQLLGRLVHFKKTGQGEIYNLIGFIQKIKAKVHTNEFMIDSHALKIRQGREAEERLAHQEKQFHPPRTKASKPPVKKPISAEQQKQRQEALNALKNKMRM